MDEAHARPIHARIDAAELNWVEVTDNGQRVCLRMRDRAGNPASVSLPAHCVNTLLRAAPRSDANLLATPPGHVHPLDGWSLTQGEYGLVLSLQLPGGAEIRFAVKSWQIAAIASLAGQHVDRRGRLN